MKKVFFAMMCIGAVYAADAAYLYWQVNGGTPGTAESDWDVARLVAAQADDAAISSWNSGGKRSGMSSNSIISDNVSSYDSTSLGSEIGAPMPVGVVANMSSIGCVAIHRDIWAFKGSSRNSLDVRNTVGSGHADGDIAA